MCATNDDVYACGKYLKMYAKRALEGYSVKDLYSNTFEYTTRP
jgi:hypothetical protein